MNDIRIPNEAPPPYSKDPETNQSDRLSVNIPAQARRSMEDERRPLPAGWVRQYDPKHNHQFFVDTKADPPRAIWHHPHDDDVYLSKLTPEERERLQEEEAARNRRQDLSDDEEPNSPAPSQKPSQPAGASSAGLNAAGASSSSANAGTQQESYNQKSKFGRKLKDKLTGSTHEEREQQRARRAEEERQAYEMHLKVRNAMNRALETGQPQFVAKDREGHDIYCEPPQWQGAWGSPNGYGNRYRGYSPYQQGVYADPNARFIRPAAPYSRPYGGSYGGGIGLPLAGGLAGGLLLGGLLGI